MVFRLLLFLLFFQSLSALNGINHDWEYRDGFDRPWLQQPERYEYKKLARFKDLNDVAGWSYRGNYISLRKKLAPGLFNGIDSASTLAFYSGDISNVAILYLDDRLVSMNGSINPYRPAYRKQLFTNLPTFDISKPHYLHIVLYTQGDFPLMYFGRRLEVGESKELFTRVFHREIVTLSLLSVYLAIGLYYLVLWSKKKEDKHHLFISLFILAIAAFTLFKSDTREMIFGYEVLWRSRCENISAYLSVPMLLLFLSNYFERKNSRVALFWLGFTTVLATTVLFSSFNILRRALLAFEIAAALTMPYVLYFIIKHALKKNKDAYYLVGGVILLLAGATTDMLEDRQLIESVPVFQYSISVFVIGIAVLLINRFIQVHHEVENLNRTLEKKVLDRTRDLQQANSELQKKDDLLQLELNFAADIQKGIIPHEKFESDHLKVYAYWQPMDKVSGDYFDIFSLTDRRTGILLCDVSGHGVPAALVTTMAKVAFTSALIESEQPAEVFSRVNENLVKFINTQDYLTAFFLTISKSLEMHYTNAAHQHALWQNQKNQVELLDTYGMFIGAMEDASQGYEQKSVQLAPGDRIILYTDGITERKNRYSELYGQDRLIETLLTTRGDDIETASKKIIHDVYSFAGSEPANDDTTLLVIEVTG